MDDKLRNELKTLLEDLIKFSVNGIDNESLRNTIHLLKYSPDRHIQLDDGIYVGKLKGVAIFSNDCDKLPVVQIDRKDYREEIVRVLHILLCSDEVMLVIGEFMVHTPVDKHTENDILYGETTYKKTTLSELKSSEWGFM